MAARSEPAAKAITFADFARRLDTLLPHLKTEKAVAVALSGGGDSMALTYLLANWANKNGVALHALTVDHGLRAEAAAEAKQVGVWVKDWGLTHQILKWTGAKPKTRIQEEARAARYRLLAQYCRKHAIHTLFLAHHANDQAETILFRFAKGSGVDGLGGMSALQPFDQTLTLARPLLDETHESLLVTCKARKIPWVEDISNVSDRYARIRLRKSQEILEAEGLTVKRLLTIGARLERAGNALNQLTETAWKKCALEINKKQIVFNRGVLSEYPEEIVIRLLQKGMMQFRSGKSYPPRLESVEALAHDLLHKASFRAATLGNCIIRIHRKAGTVSIRPEHAKLP